MFALIRISDNKTIGIFHEKSTAEYMQEMAEVATRIVFTI